MMETNNEVPEPPPYRDAGMKLQADPARAVAFKDATGLYVNAEIDGVVGTYDIAALTSDSLEEWLHNDPATAVNLVALLLGHRRAR